MKRVKREGDRVASSNDNAVKLRLNIAHHDHVIMKPVDVPGYGVYAHVPCDEVVSDSAHV